MDGPVVPAPADDRPDGGGVGVLAWGFLAAGVIAGIVAVLQAPDFARGWLDINVLAPFGGDLRILPTAPPAAVLLLGAAGLWGRRRFGKWAAWLIVVALVVGAAGLALLGVVVILLTGSSFMGAVFDAERMVPLGLALVLCAAAAAVAARAIATTVSRAEARFRSWSIVDLAGVAVFAIAVAATSAVPAAVAPDPIQPYSSPAAAGQPNWKFGIGVTEIEIGSAPITNAPSGDPQTANVVASMAVHLELEPGEDLQLVGPLRLCLRYDAASDTSLPLCWGGDKLTKLVNTQISAPADPAAPWVMTPATAATFDVTLERDPASCDYPPGPWMLEVFATSPDTSIGRIYVTARVDVPAEGPQTSIGPRVTSEWLCMPVAP